MTRWFLSFYVLLLLLTLGLARWGPDEYKCSMAMFIAPHKVETICKRVYPDWGKEDATQTKQPMG